MATVELRDRAFSPFPLPAPLTVKVRRWSAAMPGGPDRATITLSGPPGALWEVTRWLRYEVRIRADDGTLVWWGYVHGVTVPWNGAQVGLSLEGMHNRVKVLYSYDDADGAAQTGETAWVQTQTSIDTYGTKEVRFSAGDALPAEADALAAQILASEKEPVADARPGRSDGTATLDCRGWWNALDWQYYEDLSGRVVAEETNGEQTMGWALTSTELAWTRTRQVSHNGNALAALREGDYFRVSGSTSNNIIYFVKSGPGDKATTETYTASTIWFDAADDIMDTAGKGLGIFKTDDVISTAGSTNNNGFDVVDSAGADHLVVDSGYGGLIVSDGAGPSITITRWLTAKLDSTGVVREAPGASTTLTLAGQKMAMKWTPPVGTWAAGEVMVKLRKVGAPADNVTVDIYSDSAGAVGSTLVHGSLAASAIGTASQWHTFIMNTPLTVSAGTYYWVVVGRSGAASDTAYYSVAVDESFSGTLNALKLWDGSAWAERQPNADGVFQVWGVRESATTMEAIAESCGLVANADVGLATTALLTRHYRDGSMTAQDELDKLLKIGTAAGGALECTVTPLRTVRVAPEPTASRETDLLLDGDGIHTAAGVLLTPGAMPVGKWARLRNMPLAHNTSKLAALYLQAIEWDNERHTWDWTPRGPADVEDLWTLKNG